jgi:hypothetical protein
MKRQSGTLVICLKNDGYEASLEKRKIDLSLTDEESEKHGLLRVVDESGEDYLYPRRFFAAIELPAALRKQVMQAA